jgi:hypothetical protein
LVVVGSSAVVHDAVGDVEDGVVTVQDQEPTECSAHPAEGSALATAQELSLRGEPLGDQPGERFAEPADRIGYAGLVESSILLSQHGRLDALLVDTIPASAIGAVFVGGGPNDRAEVAGKGTDVIAWRLRAQLRLGLFEHGQ